MHEELSPDSPNAMCSNTSDCSTPRTPLDIPLARSSWIDHEMNIAGNGEAGRPEVRPFLFFFAYAGRG